MGGTLHHNRRTRELGLDQDIANSRSDSADCDAAYAHGCGRRFDFRAVPLEPGHGIRQTAQQRIRPAHRRLRDGHDAHFGSNQRRGSAEGVSEQLMAWVAADEGSLQLGHEAPDGRLLRHQPRVGALLPDFLGARP